ncbi:hypothetical protein [Streptomyces sp. NBC_01314]|uniref:hypothetical protein n=1 Tax=Streptomyces sp. NBC_01314 TaxID=2903821 RepID=UPI003085A391|nr:hypothetical protein OG622_01920 [Streptomyces sp. NBC_01314]
MTGRAMDRYAAPRTGARFVDAVDDGPRVAAVRNLLGVGGVVGVSAMASVKGW